MNLFRFLSFRPGNFSLERGVLFVVKSDGARGLAGFGFCANAAERGEKVRKLSVEIGVTPAFAEAVSTGTTQRAREEDGLGGALAAVMEPGHRSEAVLIGCTSGL